MTSGISQAASTRYITIERTTHEHAAKNEGDGEARAHGKEGRAGQAEEPAVQLGEPGVEEGG
jgi:hypothetical protein